MIDRGTMSGRQRTFASLYLVASAAAFLLVPDILPSAIAALRTGDGPDWSLLAGDRVAWTTFICSIGVVVIANLMYGRVTRWQETVRRRFFLVVSVAGNLGILFVFKYFDFFATSFAAVVESTLGVTPGTWTLDVVLPVGISFYTFQTMSYTIDVYRRELESSDHFVEFATYVAFFPQLVAGPIERGKHLLPQFRRPRGRLTRAAFEEGVWLVVWGLFKKMVVADNMAVIVNRTFEPFDTLATTTAPDDGLRLLVAVYAFAFQIYGDFSGYSDIARGTSRLLGFDIMVNFRLPYFATSPSTFWRGWHISLSTWLRDYLYIPLGGNRHGTGRTYGNLLATMLLGGLWHGAAWTFVIWGAFHGLLLVVYRALGIHGGPDTPWPRRLVMGLVMFHLTCVGWLIFRAQNVTTIGVFLQSIFAHPGVSPETLADLRSLAFHGWFLVLFQVVQGLMGTLTPMPRFHWFIRLNVWIYLVMSLVTVSQPGGREFIYFAF
jgi:D-alanyl-lipoteichoic acid acyltransferase DltB (MBOAT superfamily)